MLKALKIFFKSLINILYPKRCAVCYQSIKSDSVDELVCRQCWLKIKKNVPPFCSVCGRHLENPGISGICKSCQDKKYSFNRVYSACVYEGVLKELIHQFKYSKKEYLGTTLARLLIESIQGYGLPPGEFDFVIPVPLHRRKLREREFNQTDLLAETVALEFKLVLLKDGLLRIRDTLTQTELSPQERRENIRGCFMANPRLELKNKNVLLIDDLLTTGATCSEAAYALKNAGCRNVTVLTLAN